MPAGGKAVADDRIFAGAKVVSIIEAYGEAYGIHRFDLMIDWGWFAFLTKPMFWLLAKIHALVGNFGLAILIVTVLVKLVFFPLANKSYESMSKMKKLQPEMERLKQQYPDDRMALQKEMMELYKKEKVIAGFRLPAGAASRSRCSSPSTRSCSSPSRCAMRRSTAGSGTFRLPTRPACSICSASSPGIRRHFLMIGVWPLIMGITMWMQMRLNPTPPDPIQASLFNWMPIIFTFMLAAFPAGLVIYWAWNNLLSIAQQSVIMKRQGVRSTSSATFAKACRSSTARRRVEEFCQSRRRIRNSTRRKSSVDGFCSPARCGFSWGSRALSSCRPPFPSRWPSPAGPMSASPRF